MLLHLERNKEIVLKIAFMRFKKNIIYINQDSEPRISICSSAAASIPVVDYAI